MTSMTTPGSGVEWVREILTGCRIDRPDVWRDNTTGHSDLTSWGGVMAKVGATEFKAKCLELMDRVQARRETFVITKRGKPVARLVPLERPRTSELFGCMTGKATITGDITAPAIAAEGWEIAREWDELNAPEERLTSSKGRKKARRRTVSR